MHSSQGRNRLIAVLAIWTLVVRFAAATDDRPSSSIDPAVKVLPPIEWSGSPHPVVTHTQNRDRTMLDGAVVAPEEMEILDSPVFSSRPVQQVSGVINSGAAADAFAIDQTFLPPRIPPAKTPLPPVGMDGLSEDPVDISTSIEADADADVGPLLVPPLTNAAGPLFRIPDERVPHYWIQSDVLLWWTNGVDLSSVVTTSPAGTPGLQAGVLGQPGTSVLWGNEELFDSLRSGFRLRGGEWYEEDDGSGWQAEFLMLGSTGHNFHGQSNGQPVLARPFFNEATGQQDAQLVAFPAVVDGALAINAETRLYSLSLSLWGEIMDERVEDRSRTGEPRHARTCLRSGTETRTMGLRIGPRFIHHDDSILFDEFARSQATGNEFRILDSFKTENSFLGGEFGLRGRRQKGPISVDLGVNVALGATRQELDVSGYTAISTGTGTTLSPSGLYAQPTNSGSWDETTFSVVPSLEVALGYETANGWRFSVGYDVIYWTNVLRAAEQIDFTVHPDQLPPAVTPNSATRPSVLLHESDYFAQGLSFAIERRW